MANFCSVVKLIISYTLVDSSWANIFLVQRFVDDNTFVYANFLLYILVPSLFVQDELMTLLQHQSFA
jgi:hypothetical protein